MAKALPLMVIALTIVFGGAVLLPSNDSEASTIENYDAEDVLDTVIHYIGDGGEGLKACHVSGESGSETSTTIDGDAYTIDSVLYQATVEYTNGLAGVYIDGDHMSHAYIKVSNETKHVFVMDISSKTHTLKFDLEKGWTCTNPVVTMNGETIAGNFKDGWPITVKDTEVYIIISGLEISVYEEPRDNTMLYAGIAVAVIAIVAVVGYVAFRHKL